MDVRVTALTADFFLCLWPFCSCFGLFFLMFPRVLKQMQLSVFTLLQQEQSKNQQFSPSEGKKKKHAKTLETHPVHLRLEHGPHGI